MTAYLQLPDIQGDITTEGFKQWIGLRSVHHHLDNQARRMVAGHYGDRFKGQTLFSEFELIKTIDATSPLIFQNFCQGTNMPKVKLALVSTGTPLRPYLEYELTDVIISRLNRFYDGGAQPSEVIHLNFTKIQEKFTPYNQRHQAQAPVIAGYDISRAEVL